MHTEKINYKIVNSPIKSGHNMGFKRKKKGRKLEYAIQIEKSHTFLLISYVLLSNSLIYVTFNRKIDFL